MIKILISLWQVLVFFWTKVRPIFHDVIRIIDEAKKQGLSNDDARKKVFQDATDFIQARGLDKVPDSVLNCSIELCYQIYIWNKSKGNSNNNENGKQ
jgi:hypothetical protein